jgi:regulation of enolase protein 1 (concanavalin A-like superfamily)
MPNPFDKMTWLHEPLWGAGENSLWVETESGTDFWQRTHYGFQRDNAHALLKPVYGAFTLRAAFRFFPNAQYDQCGLYLRIDENNWFKCSVEYEDGKQSRLGSVLTRGGYSDWATQDIPADLQDIVYRVEFEHDDLMAAWSIDGADWRQMRVAHLDTAGATVSAGIYGCSPTGPGFRFEVRDFVIERR